MNPFDIPHAPRKPPGVVDDQNQFESRSKSPRGVFRVKFVFSSTKPIKTFATVSNEIHGIRRAMGCNFDFMLIIFGLEFISMYPFDIPHAPRKPPGVFRNRNCVLDDVSSRKMSSKIDMPLLKLYESEESISNKMDETCRSRRYNFQFMAISV